MRRISLDTWTALAWTLLIAVCAFGIGNSPTRAEKASAAYQQMAAFGIFQAANNPPPSLVLPAANNIATNWGNAGLTTIGGIPNRTTQCGITLNTTGLTPPQANDDAAKLTAAISACTAGQVIQFGCGTFNYAQSELPIAITKGITLRGCATSTATCDATTGTPCWGTVLQTYDGPQPAYTSPPKCGVTLGGATTCSNASGMFIILPTGLFNTGWSGCAWPAGSINPTTNNCGTTITADANQGDTSVTVTSATNFSVGQWVLIDESPQLVTTTNPVPGQASIQASSEFLNNTPTPVVARIANPDAGNCTYSFCVNRVTEELHKITGIVGNVISFDSPLTIGFRQSGSHDGRLYWSTAQSTTTPVGFVQQASFENMTLYRCNGGCLNFTFCALCWVSNVEAAYWINGAVNLIGTARSYLFHSWFHDCIDCQNNGVEYPIGVSSASTENLIEDVIVTKGGKGMVGRAAVGNVVAYSYFDQSFYDQASLIGDYWNDMAANASHYAGTHHFLFEGNRSNNCDGDETHGNATYHTFFSNHCFAYRTPFTDPSNSLAVNDCGGIGYAASNAPQAPGPLRAAGPMAFNYWYAYVANVLGNSAMQSCATGTFVYGAGSTFGNRVMWRSGWTGSEWGTITDSNLDNVSGLYIFKNCNYDYVNTSAIDCATGYAHTFPNSLYLPSSGASPPSWWPSGSTTYAYPPFVATSGSPIKTNSLGGSALPALARFNAGTPFTNP